jgi:hypothetical protein
VAKDSSMRERKGIGKKEGEKKRLNHERILGNTRGKWYKDQQKID